MAAWILLWVLVGRWLHDLVQQLGDAGRFLEDAGGDLAGPAVRDLGVGSGPGAPAGRRP